MSPSECMRILELGESASIDQIKHGYRQLAQRCHPDKHGGNPEQAKRFALISHAYHTLLRTARVIADGGSVGQCTICREFDKVTRGRDGRLYCSRCVFRPSAGRLLPMPAITVAHCLGTVAMLLAAVYLLVRALTAGDSGGGLMWAALAFAIGVISLVRLAWTAIRIAHCLTAREQFILEHYLAAVRETSSDAPRPRRCRRSAVRYAS